MSGDDVDRLLVEAIATGSGGDAPDGLAAASATILARLPRTQSLRADVERHLAEVRDEVRREERRDDRPIPTRISVTSDDGVIRVAAITETATVPERIIAIDRSLLDDLVERMTDPPVEQVAMLGGTLYRFLTAPDFRTLQILSGSGPFVFEVDRSTAPFHWEMCDFSQPTGTDEPLGVQSQVARQLRTAYSSVATRPSAAGRRLRALVIGDPGDPDKRHDLPGARSEALAVADLLAERGVDVDVRIGAPSLRRTGRLADIAPADRLEVLSLLSGGGYDLIHYAGHGDFHAERPRTPRRVAVRHRAAHLERDPRARFGRRH